VFAREPADRHGQDRAQVLRGLEGEGPSAERQPVARSVDGRVVGSLALEIGRAGGDETGRVAPELMPDEPLPEPFLEPRPRSSAKPPADLVPEHPTDAVLDPIRLVPALREQLVVVQPERSLK